MRVAIVAGPDPARAFPAAALARGLTADGDDVVLVTGPRWLERLRGLGINAQVLPGVTGSPGSVEELTSRGTDEVAALTEAVVGVLDQQRPDLVVADVTMPAGDLAAERLDLPWVQLHPHPFGLGGTVTADGDSGRRRRRFSGRGPASGLRHGRPVGAGRARTSRGDGAQHTMADVRSRLGLPPAAAPPILHMVATLPSLEASRPDWPGNASVVGPLIWDPADHDLTEPPGSEPLVLVCPASAPGGQAGLLDAALTGLRDVRVAGALFDAVERSVPPWATAGTGRIEPLLAHASVCVTGGGHGVLVRALLAGVPLVMVPGDRDQAVLAHRVQELGAAVVLSKATPRGLRRAVERVLHDRDITLAARKIARNVATADPVALCHQALVGRLIG